MINSIPSSRAALRVAILTLGIAWLAFACPAQAFTPSGSKGGGENVPLTLTTPSVGSHPSSSGAGIVRTIVGLLIVLAVIWGLYWILRQVKSSRETQAGGSGLTSMATLPLGTGRSLHLIRAGADYLLVGSAEHGVTPIYRYTEQQAREAGLLSDEDPAKPSSGGPGLGGPGTGTGTGLDRPHGRTSFGGSSNPLRALLDRLRLMTVRT
jgi:flagellar protein FliO/FliZ